VANVRNKPAENGKYQGWYKNYRGKRIFFTGTTKKVETRRIAEDHEHHHAMIRLGQVPPPSKATRAGKRQFSEVTHEYLDWGNSQGGRDGRPWGRTHAKERKNKLAWWQQRLNLDRLSDLNGILPEVEKALRDLQRHGHETTGRPVSGKTLRNYAECLRSFCRWAKKREYLDRDPLENLDQLNGAPTSVRRVLTNDEVVKLLEIAPDHRRLVYETALMTGLRAGELRSLTTDDIDLTNSKLVLHAEWTKNRKAGYQPIPGDLALRLHEYGVSGAARQLYNDRFGRVDAVKEGVPENPLLFVSTHPSRELDIDLQKAGIPKHVNGEGKVDFHSLRNRFISWLMEAGANPKEAQVLARHSDVRLTMNTYARAQKDSLNAIVDSLLAHVPQKKCAVCVQKPEKEGDGDDAISHSDNDLGAAEGWWRRRDSNPRPVTGTRQALHA